MSPCPAFPSSTPYINGPATLESCHASSYAILSSAQHPRRDHLSCVRPVLDVVPGTPLHSIKFPTATHLTLPYHTYSTTPRGRSAKDLTSWLERCSARANVQALALSWPSDLDLVLYVLLHQRDTHLFSTCTLTLAQCGHVSACRPPPSTVIPSTFVTTVIWRPPPLL